MGLPHLLLEALVQVLDKQPLPLLSCTMVPLQAQRAVEASMASNERGGGLRSQRLLY